MTHCSRLVLAIFLIASSAASTAQTARLIEGTDAPELTTASQRSRIAEQRAQVQADYSRKETACYSLFAVNDCLSQARIARREALADLQRQENTLNDAERKRKSAQKIQSIDDKLAQDRLATDAAARVRPPAVPASASVDSAAARREHESRLARQQSEQAQRAEQATQAPGKRQQYEERLRKAQERRAEHEKKLLKAQQDAASAPKALPVPP